MAEFLESNDIAPAILPIDLSGQDNDGNWVSLSKVLRCVVVFFAGPGTTGDDPVVTLRQAKDGNGAGAKSLDFTSINSKVGTLSELGQWLFTAKSSPSNTYIDDSAGESEKLLAIEVKPEDLDATNDYSHIQLQIPDTGSAQQFGCGFYVLIGLAQSRICGDTESGDETTTTTSAPTTTGPPV